MADTPLPLFLPYPRFLLKMEISQTAKLLYSLLLDRSTLTEKQVAGRQGQDLYYLSHRGDSRNTG